MCRWVLVGAITILAPALAAPAKPNEIKAQLAIIQKVGRKGTGNTEAAKAWKALVAAGVPALLPTLQAIDDDNLTAANWLRPAANAIVEKALAKKEKIAAADLDKFIANTKHARIARRLAYEVLVKVDKKAPERWLERFLKDPSPELRREGVADAIKKAEAVDNDRGKIAAYQKALAGACDQDQVDDIAKVLKKLGVTVDLAKHFGFVLSWHLIAPFENTKKSGWNVAYPPEKSVDLTKTYTGKNEKEAKWVAHTTTDPYGMVNLNKALAQHKGAVGYAYAEVNSETARPIEIRVGCITGLKIFLNGKQIFARDEYHHGMRLDQYAARGQLKAGKNTILVKVCQNEQTENWAQLWQFQLRLCDYTGVAVPFTQGAKKEDK